MYPDDAPQPNTGSEAGLFICKLTFLSIVLVIPSYFLLNLFTEVTIQNTILIVFGVTFGGVLFYGTLMMVDLIIYLAKEFLKMRR